MSTQSYIHDLRQAVGPRPINLVGAAGLVLSEAGDVLLLRRVGGRTWGVVTGISELGEALEETLRRELHEETGLTLTAAILLDVISGPETYREIGNGDRFSAYTALYRATGWHGVPVPDGMEIEELRFFPPDALPELAGPVSRRAVQFLAAQVPA
ncbi:NUDIX hydrolase [Deinococcus koreensis]|uniref:DNA mismatch repair protein MutT n=1 Tax=Deinococcus koreensis TaxID=2054903 RepID=A0A2K3UZV0_9DEIO|nr:NUDIX domain-containing protein [Deinococcus koreensis]PNY82060.1 DNA mismatch repair protein MutT [Deinococcus koreensis]